MFSFKGLVIVGYLLGFHLYANDSFVVIVSKDSTLKEITKQELSKIFLAKTKQLPNGERAITVELGESYFKEYFYNKICGKSLKQLKRYWATMIFTGRGHPPKKMKNTQETIEFVKNSPNAISYLPKDEVREKGIKVVLELE